MEYYFQDISKVIGCYPPKLCMLYTAGIWTINILSIYINYIIKLKNVFLLIYCNGWRIYSYIGTTHLGTNINTHTHKFKKNLK
jgi:hypothetical protein